MKRLIPLLFVLAGCALFTTLPFPMLSNQAITRRFNNCLAEVLIIHTQARVAKALQTDSPYLTRLKSAKNPKIPTLLIARFCQVYNYSPHYILLGKGEKRGPMSISKEEGKDMYYLKIIDSLLHALIENKGTWSDATSELVQKAMANRR